MAWREAAVAHSLVVAGGTHSLWVGWGPCPRECQAGALLGNMTAAGGGPWGRILTAEGGSP